MEYTVRDYRETHAIPVVHVRLPKLAKLTPDPIAKRNARKMGSLQSQKSQADDRRAK